MWEPVEQHKELSLVLCDGLDGSQLLSLCAAPTEVCAPQGLGSATKRSHGNENPVHDNKQDPHSLNQRKPTCSNKDPAQPKILIFKIIKIENKWEVSQSQISQHALQIFNLFNFILSQKQFLLLGTRHLSQSIILSLCYYL